MTDKREVTLVLPRLVSSRNGARALLDELGPLEGRVVVLNARDLRSASPSAADEFVKQALIERGASALEVAGATPDLLKDLGESAKARQVGERLRILELS